MPCVMVMNPVVDKGSEMNPSPMLARDASHTNKSFFNFRPSILVFIKIGSPSAFRSGSNPTQLKIRLSAACSDSLA